MSVYRSTLAKRTEDVRPADFTQAQGLRLYALNDRKQYSPPNDSPTLLREQWNRFVPFLPRQILDLFTQGYSQKPSVSVFINSEGVFRVQVRAPMIGLNGHRDFHLGAEQDYVAEAGGNVDIQRRFRGQGLGRIWMTNNAEFALALGQKSLHSVASSEGGFVWARYGMKLDESYVGNPDLVKSLNWRLELFRTKLSEDDYGRAKNLCEVREPRALIRLSREMDNVIVFPITKNEIERAAANAYPSEDGQSHDDAKGQIDLMSQVFNQAAKSKQQGPILPAALLTGTSWPNVIDFSDFGQMEDIGLRAGWRTIVPT